MDVGFIGLGNMGARMVEGLIEGGHTVHLWARRPASVEPFAGRASVAGSPAEVGAASDVVGICVWDEHDVDDVLLGEQGVLAGLRPGGVVAIHSTISPDACRRLHGEAASRGCSLVDAPVSVGASAPKLLTMVGGDAASVERCLPTFESFGDPVLHLGPVGSGQVAKLVNNTLLAAAIGLGDDALALGEALGLDGAALLAALSSGSARGTWSVFFTQRYGPARALSGRTGEWARKDVGLTIDLAVQAGLDIERPVLAMGGRGADVLDGD